MISSLINYFNETEPADSNENQETIINHMGAENHIPNSLTNLRLLVNCWFLGEPTYYKKGTVKTKLSKELYLVPDFHGETTMDIFKNVVNKALEEDFEGVLKLASQSRNEFMMRSGPCAILYYAVMHTQRAAFNAEHPLLFRQYAKEIIKIPTDAWQLFELYTKEHSDGKNSKQKLPTILKKVLSDHLESLEAYQMKKYLNKCHLVDLIRISHASSKVNPLIENVVNKTLTVEDDAQTWETLRSQGKTWPEILEQIKIPHMALLRNLVGISKEVEDLTNIIDKLKKGVKHGKQFPYRYLSAYEEVSKLDKPLLLQGIAECVELAMEAFPILEGNVVCLSDNSGSAWGAFPSQYGKQTVAKIGNLSSIMTAKRCTGKGYVGVFGNRLTMLEIDKDKTVLEQQVTVDAAGKNVGAATENGIWIFFKEAFEEFEKTKDVSKMSKFANHICIYSDMQCGHGGLYGNSSEYPEFQMPDHKYIDVLKLINKYRELINPKVNVYCVQISAYNNTLIPEHLYRTHIMSGWSGNEIVYMDKMNKLMNEMDQL